MTAKQSLTAKNIKNPIKMKKIIANMTMVMLLMLSACSSTKSLQEYYIDNSENTNFLSLDVPTSILNLDNADLSATQKEALVSLKKLNILAFKKTKENTEAFKIEKTNVKAILKNDKFVDEYKLW